ncbi:MAG TPA: hypothetical protein DIT50_07390, partial [Rhodocyclaceae bacterium]|nr:hypothetical protein [Rhodocyclaceae bacterium]
MRNEWRRVAVRWLAGFCGMWMALSAWATNLTGLELVEGGDGQASLMLRFDAAVPAPAHFQMSGPVRAIFDFVGAKNGLGRSEERFARAGVDRVYLVESGQRLRVVLVLDEPVPYALAATPEGWRIDWRRAAQPASEPVANAIAAVASARSA